MMFFLSVSALFWLNFFFACRSVTAISKATMPLGHPQLVILRQSVPLFSVCRFVVFDGGFKHIKCFSLSGEQFFFSVNMH